MKRRHPNHRLVKIHRSYTVEEIATLFGVHKNTVSHWVAETSDDRLLVKMRESGERPWWWITDSGRWVRNAPSPVSSFFGTSMFKTPPDALQQRYHSTATSALLITRTCTGDMELECRLECDVLGGSQP